MEFASLRDRNMYFPEVHVISDTPLTSNVRVCFISTDRTDMSVVVHGNETHHFPESITYPHSSGKESMILEFITRIVGNIFNPEEEQKMLKIINDCFGKIETRYGNASAGRDLAGGDAVILLRTSNDTPDMRQNVHDFEIFSWLDTRFGDEDPELEAIMIDSGKHLVKEGLIDPEENHTNIMNTILFAMDFYDSQRYKLNWDMNLQTVINTVIPLVPMIDPVKYK